MNEEITEIGHDLVQNIALQFNERDLLNAFHSTLSNHCGWYCVIKSAMIPTSQRDTKYAPSAFDLGVIPAFWYG